MILALLPVTDSLVLEVPQLGDGCNQAFSTHKLGPRLAETQMTDLSCHLGCVDAYLTPNVSGQWAKHPRDPT